LLKEDNEWWYKCVVGNSIDLETLKKQLDVYLMEISQLSSL
jgi:hypothetical protein